MRMHLDIFPMICMSSQLLILEKLVTLKPDCCHFEKAVRSRLSGLRNIAFFATSASIIMWLPEICGFYMHMKNNAANYRERSSM